MPEEEKKEPTEAKEQPAVAEKAEPKAEKPAKKAEDEAPGREPPPPGGIADLFAKALPDIELEAYQGITDVIIEVSRDDIPKVMQTAKEDPQLNLNFLRSLFGVDHMEEGLEVVYQLFSYDKKHGVTIKARLPVDDAKVASVTPVWKGANWHERETRDMFGIDFEGHPHLAPLLLPEDMTDHFPLRKDNPLAEIEEWQGDLLGEDEAEGKE